MKVQQARSGVRAKTPSTQASGRKGTPRTIVLGLDSVDLNLVKRWVSEGHLPFFREMLANDPVLSLKTPSRAVQGSVWPALMSSASPGRHGLYLFSQLKNGTYDFIKPQADHGVLRRFYEDLGAAGVRCGIADIPMDSPVTNFNGVHIVDWATEFKFWEYVTQPIELAREIEEKVGKHPLTTYTGTGRSARSHSKLRRELEVGVRKKAELARYLIQRDDLDLVFLVFAEPHKAGHFLWKYWDADHPDHEPHSPELSSALLECYQQIDGELARLTQLVGQDDNLIILSDHGMQANYRGDHLVEPILVKLGLLVRKGTMANGSGASRIEKRELKLWSRIPKRKKAMLRRLVPEFMKDSLRPLVGAPASIDWQRTHAWVLPTDRNSYIRINVRGREPQGTVSPGEEYEKMLDHIEGELRALINPATGRAAVQDVFRLHALYPGEHVEDLPDISVLWNAESPLDAVTSPTLGLIERRIVERRSGNHRAEGFVLARGPAFRDGRGAYEGDVMQIAPTLLHLHGVAIPGDYEMGPLYDILSPEKTAMGKA